MHFWHPSRIRIFGSENGLEPKREENYGIDKFLVFKSQTFLAPLSDPIFGSEKAPEPKRRKIMESICFCYSIPKHFWHPSRIPCLAPKRLRSPNGICCLAPKKFRSSSWQRDIAPEFHSWEFNLTNPYKCCNVLRRM